MLTRHTIRPPQTIKEAKAEYKKYGPRISSQEKRHLERGGELFRRAEKIREAEKKRQAAKLKKLERETREREARQRMGISSQKPAIPRSQCLLEGFVKVMKARNTDVRSNVKFSTENDPWFEDEIDDGALIGALTAGPDPIEDAKASEAGVCGHEHTAPRTTTKPRLEMEADIWTDFLASNTQIEREITVDRPAIRTESKVPVDDLLALLSTQEVSFTAADLKELGVKGTPSTPGKKSVQITTGQQSDRALMPPPILPIKKMTCLSRPPQQVADLASMEFELSTQDYREIG